MEQAKRDQLKVGDAVVFYGGYELVGHTDQIEGKVTEVTHSGRLMVKPGKGSGDTRERLMVPSALYTK